MAMARRPSASQTRSHVKAENGPASDAAPSAVTPMMMYPQPETAVNAADRSMVSRMKRRSSAAVNSGKAELLVEGILVERRLRRMRWEGDSRT